MTVSKAAKKAAVSTPAPNQGEQISEMEPMLISQGSRFRPELTALAFELTGKAAGFRRSLPNRVSVALADLVRSMNCYYSNLIEGHTTHPVEIERALKGEYSDNIEERNLQLEAKAHIAVQKWIDDGNLRGQATTRHGICEVHRRFCGELPNDLLSVEDPATHARLPVVPGEFRRNHVKVGRLVPLSPGAVPRFMERFESVYTGLNKVESVLAAAVAHHRLAWIHPFLDGNGRVARLMSHATLLETLDTGAIWSVARGLAKSESSYKEHLRECDLPRRNDLDGRGNLSEEALASFTRFFLETCLDQVTFMETLMQPDRLRTRILLWAEEETRLNRLPPKSSAALEAILYRGELPRGDVAGLLDLTPRHARRIVSELVKRGVLTSKRPRDPLLLAFPAALASRWMPGLFPERASDD